MAGTGDNRGLAQPVLASDEASAHRAWSPCLSAGMISTLLRAGREKQAMTYTQGPHEAVHAEGPHPAASCWNPWPKCR